MNDCSKCIHSVKACDENVLGCQQLHSNRLTPFEVRGEVFEGWYGKGTGRLFNGYVVSGNAVCYLFEADETKIESEIIDKYKNVIEETICKLNAAIRE